MEKRNEYELTFICDPQLEDEGLKALTAKVQERIAAAGGEVTRTDTWGRRRLAYPIRKNREGFYVLLRVLLPSKATGPLERELRLTEHILRHLLVRAETIPLGTLPSSRPSAAARPAIKPEPVPEAQTDTEPEPEPEVELEPEPEPVLEAETDAEPEPEREPEPQSDEPGEDS